MKIRKKTKSTILNSDIYHFLSTSINLGLEAAASPAVNTANYFLNNTTYSTCYITRSYNCSIFLTDTC